MKKTMSVVVVFMLIGCGLAFGAGPTAWVVPSTLLRVGPTDAAGSGTTATIYGGQGEYVAFQVAVQAPSGGLTNVTLSVSSLTGPGSATIPSSSLILYRESYITISAAQHSSAGFETSGLPYTSDNGVQNAPITTSSETLPDALIPAIDPATGNPPTSGASYTFELSSLAASNNTVFWVDTFVPRGTTAGTYTGTYTVSSTQGSADGTISLTVWNFTVPLKPSLRSLFGGGDSNLSAGGALAAGIEAELLRNRLMPDTPNLVNVSTDISQYGLNDFDLGYYENVSYGACTGSDLKPAPPTLTALQGAVNAQPTGLYLSDYTADPESSCTNTAYYNSVIAWAKVLHQAVVTGVPGQIGVDNMVSQRPDSAAAAGGLFNDGLGTGRSAVDDWAMLPQDYDVAQTDTYDGLPNVTYVLQKGDKVWSYTDEVLDYYSPKWELDFLPINYRIWPGFLNQSLKITGTNYWAISNWNSESAAWTSSLSKGYTNSSEGYFPEEGILVYPGGPAGLQSTSSYQGVAPSMRLKYLRDGEQDYEYLQLLKNCGQTPNQTAIYSLSASGSEDPNWHDWTMNEANLESARVTLGNQINSECSSGVTLESIAITPVSASITAGGTEAFTATGTYSSGPTQNISSTVTWTSSSTAVATIASTGVATGVAAGTSNITASLGGVTSNTATLTVTAPTLESIAITPTSASITAGGTEAFTATGTYSSGPTQNITSTVTWTSSSTAVATIASTGVATGVAAGTSNITASLGGVTSNTATLTVTAPTLESIAITPTSALITAGGTEAFTATGTYSSGPTQNITSSVTWTSSSTTVATIASTGVATGKAAGTTNITAKSGSITSNTAALTVTAASPIAVSITAPANNATVSGVTTLTATASGGVGGVASVQFIIDYGYSDQENAGAAITKAPYTTTFNFATLSAAWYDVTALATDTAGNTATATIEVDDTD